jgi:hypothetical protein
VRRFNYQSDNDHRFFTDTRKTSFNARRLVADQLVLVLLSFFSIVISQE